MNPSCHIVLSVTNDLITDQRVHRTCTTLLNEGHDVTLVGRQLKTSNFVKRPYRTKRFRLFFQKGPLFYAFYNLRLFLFLVFNKTDILVANDLDTLPANYLISWLKQCKLVYDSHEYFCHVPELTHRTFIRKIWLAIEKWIFPNLKNVITVNDTIAQLYSNEYGVSVQTIRNLPISISDIQKESTLSRKDLGLPEGKIIIYQGAVNKDRGLEEAILAMHNVPDAILLIIGDGDMLKGLITLVEEESLSKKVIFKGKLKFEELYNYTANADLGIAIEKDTNLNYKYSLSNKLFDYIHAGTPILASSLPGSIKLIEKYDIGALINDHNPKSIALKMTTMLQDPDQLSQWKGNTQKAALEYCWENERTKLLSFIREIQ